MSIASQIEDFLDSKGSATRDAYARGLRGYADFRGMPLERAVEELLTGGGDTAAERVAAFREALLVADRSPSLVNRNLSALREFVAFSARQGRAAFQLRVRGVVASVPRAPLILTPQDVEAAITAYLRHAGRTPLVRRLRNVALVRLVYHCDLAREQLHRANLEDVLRDEESGVPAHIRVLTRGQAADDTIRIPPGARAALDEWLSMRPAGGIALFTALEPGFAGERLSIRGITHVVGQVFASVERRGTTINDIRRAGMRSRVARIGSEIVASSDYVGISGPIGVWNTNLTA
jgi:site-specific recombinase XerC